MLLALGASTQHCSTSGDVNQVLSTIQHAHDLLLQLLLACYPKCCADAAEARISSCAFECISSSRSSSSGLQLGCLLVQVLAGMKQASLTSKRDCLKSQQPALPNQVVNSKKILKECKASPSTAKGKTAKAAAEFRHLTATTRLVQIMRQTATLPACQ